MQVFCEITGPSKFRELYSKHLSQQFQKQSYEAGIENNKNILKSSQISEGWNEKHIIFIFFTWPNHMLIVNEFIMINPTYISVQVHLQSLPQTCS